MIPNLHDTTSREISCSACIVKQLHLTHKCKLLTILLLCMLHTICFHMLLSYEKVGKLSSSIGSIEIKVIEQWRLPTPILLQS